MVPLALSLIAQLVTAAALLGHGPVLSSPPDDRAVQFIGVDSHTSPLRDRIAQEMPAAVDAVVAFWGSDWPRDIVVILTDTDTAFAAQTAEPLRDWNGVAAVAVADRIDPAGRSASGQRIVFAPGAAGMSDAGLRIVLRHELFHYAARTDTAADAPQWLTEGVADFVARPPTSAGSAAPPAILPSDAELTASGAVRSQAYDRAWWFSRFVADQYGRDALRQLYLRACAPGHPDVGAAVAAAVGADLPELMTQWQRWQVGP